MQKHTHITYDINDVKKIVSGEIMKAKLAKHKNLDDVKKNVSTIRQDTQELKNDMYNVKQNVGEIKEQNKKLDSKLDKLYVLVDGFAGEVKTYREQQELVGNKLSNHNDRIEKLEKHTGLPSPTS